MSRNEKTLLDQEMHFLAKSNKGSISFQCNIANHRFLETSHIETRI